MMLRTLKPEEYSEMRKAAIEEMKAKGIPIKTYKESKIIEVQTMETEQKKKLAEEVVALLDSKLQDNVEKRKVLSNAHRIVSKRIA